jgi:hypothetical protein
MKTDNSSTPGNGSRVAWTAALPVVIRRGRRKKSDLAQAHPGKPWLWKERWASGAIRASAQGLAAPLFFAIVWNAMCIPMWYGLMSGRAFRPNDRVSLWFVAAFIAAGLTMIVWAIVAVRRWRKYGRSVFEMASVPGVIGGRLAGTIRTTVKIQPEEAFCIRLSCVNCRISRADRATIVRNLVWQDEQFIARDLWRYDAYHSEIPVLFQIPYECRPTDEEDPNSTIFWKLEVTAKTPGLDFSAEFFDVPVFKTPDSDPHFVVDRSLVAKNAAPEDPQRDLRDAGVVKIASPAGDSCRFVFPMARQPRAAVALTLLSLAFFGMPVFLFYQDSGVGAVFFGVIFGLAGLVLSIVALNLWFYRSVVDVSRRGLAFTGGLFGRGASRWIDASAVVEIKTTSHFSSDNLTYYDLVVVCRDGQKVTIGKRLPGRRLADSVIRQIEQAHGLD